MNIIQVLVKKGGGLLYLEKNEREGEGNERIKGQSHKVLRWVIIDAWIISWGPARGGAHIVGGWVVMG